MPLAEPCPRSLLMDEAELGGLLNLKTDIFRSGLNYACRACHYIIKRAGSFKIFEQLPRWSSLKKKTSVSVGG